MTLVAIDIFKIYRTGTVSRIDKRNVQQLERRARRLETVLDKCTGYKRNEAPERESCE